MIYMVVSNLNQNAEGHGQTFAHSRYDLVRWQQQRLLDRRAQSHEAD